MSAPPQSLPADTRSSLATCFSQIRLARAIELAQSGRLLEAEAVLASNGTLPQTAGELDLLARIAALQGHFGDARSRWNAALQIDPTNETYRRCLARLTPTAQILRIIANNEETLLNLLVWTTVAFALAALIYVFSR